jgi:lysophospholipase L1-like esterase
MHRIRKSFACLVLALPLFILAACKKNFPVPNLNPGALTILCLGDSITAGTHGEGDDGTLSYPGLLNGMVTAVGSSIQIVNEGQDGWTVSDVSQHVALWLQPVAPNVILLQIGTNDLEQGVSPAEAASRLDFLITQIQTLAPLAHLYVSNCTPVRDVNRPNLSLAVLEEFNDLVPKVVRDHERHDHIIVFVDLYKRAGLTGDDLGPDGEHPNDAGYQKMAVYWAWVLKKHEEFALK